MHIQGLSADSSVQDIVFPGFVPGRKAPSSDGSSFFNIGGVSERDFETGEHYIFDLSNCNHEILMDSERAASLFGQAVRQGGLTVVDEGFYKFSPHGFTCFLLLAESHASLHAWPEYDYCAVDLFTCNLGKDLLPLIQAIKNALGADNFSLRKLDRTAEIETQVPIAV